MTVGQPTISSKPSRRMFSISTVRWSSPRPETSTVSASAVSSTRSATLVSSSWMVKRSEIGNSVGAWLKGQARPLGGV